MADDDTREWTDAEREELRALLDTHHTRVKRSHTAAAKALAAVDRRLGKRGG